MKELARELDAALRDAGSKERAVHDAAYLKSDAIHHGAPVPAVRKIARGVRSLDRAELLALVRLLWKERVHDRRVLAVELLARFEKLLDARDLPLLQKLVGEAKTWALVDALATVVIGGIVAREDAGRALDAWAKREDFWIRRAAMLALLVPLRRGAGDWERFTRYADAMLEDEEFFIRKAIGWILRETGKKRPELVRRWVEPRRARMSGLTFREAMKSQPGGRPSTKEVGRKLPT